jgi:methylglyoxal synthase
MTVKKTIGLVAHDNRKADLIEWVKWNKDSLIDHQLVCTGTTGKLVSEALSYNENGERIILPNEVIRMKSGPLGGDQQLGALIAEGKVDVLIFLWDPMQPQPHDVDVKALLRLAALYNVPTAHNRSTADFIISSELFTRKYVRTVKDYSAYTSRKIS